MDTSYLHDAFKDLSILDEEVFDINQTGELEKADDFMKEEPEDIIDVMDMDFEDVESPEEDDTIETHIGDVIFDCPVCHSKVYKHADEVELDEDEEFANVGEECPYCYSADGFKIVGQVAPYKPEDEVKVEIEDKEEIEDSEDEVEEEEKEEEEVTESLKESKDVDLTEYQKWVDYDMKKYHKISDVTMNKIKKAGLSVVKDQYGEYEVIADRADSDAKNESLKNSKKVCEGFEKIEVETDDQVIKVESEEKPEVPGEEMIAPVETEVKDEIEVDSEEEGEPADFEEEPEEVDYDVEEFSEDEFNDLGESYLKNVYGNVSSFKTTFVGQNANRFVVEGLITFDSGNQKKTRFVFEAHDANKEGKVRFLGENLQISRGKKSFALRGRIDNGKFISESLNYNYRAKNQEGKSVRVYGTVKH